MNQASASVLQCNQPEATKICTAGDGWRRLGLRGVLCPAFNVRIQYPPEMAFLVLPVDDNTNVPDAWYDLAVDFHRRFSPTLVHCMAGQNRSVIFGAALLFADGMDLGEALKLLATVPVCGSILASLKRWAMSKGWNGVISIPVDASR